jgi:hypothetical protein
MVSLKFIIEGTTGRGWGRPIQCLCQDLSTENDGAKVVSGPVFADILGLRQDIIEQRESSGRELRREREKT